jgi:hypothetical protein
MSYTYQIVETLRDYDDILYKMNEIRITLSDGKFEHKALPISVIVTNEINTVQSFICIISGNQKELLSYFTTDAFTIFSGLVKIKFGYGGIFIDVIENVNIQNIIPLPSILNGIPHQIADNAWLQTI